MYHLGWPLQLCYNKICGRLEDAPLSVSTSNRISFSLLNFTKLLDMEYLLMESGIFIEYFFKKKQNKQPPPPKTNTVVFYPGQDTVQ